MNAFKNRFYNFINSGSYFNDNQQDLKIRHNIINITIMLALCGLIFGTTLNLIKADYLGAVVDIAAIFVLSVTAFFLHLKKEHFELIASIFAAEFLFLFTLLIISYRFFSKNLLYNIHGNTERFLRIRSSMQNN